MKIILESTIDKIASRVDGTVSIQVSTQELDSSKAGDLFSLRGKFCKVLISDSNISKLEEELVDNTQLVGGKKHKSQASRLRAVLYLVNEQQGGDENSFEVFYKNETERLIDHYKKKLE